MAWKPSGAGLNALDQGWPPIAGSPPAARSSAFRPILGSFAAAASFVTLLCLFLSPRWETNDDVAMSMVAHGYGIAATGMPNLIFSNVLWGYLVRLIPTINGTLGYSCAALAVLAVAGTVTTWGMRHAGFGHGASLAVLASILARPVLFPQFTINAGLLTMGAVICWHLYARQMDNRILMAGCLLALCGYWIRPEEFLLVLAVALPLLPWHSILWRRGARIAVLALISAIAVSAFVDRESYQGPAWKPFNDLNPTRALFTDFGIGAHLKQRPDLLQRHGYSANDIDLIGSWFFADPDIANPKALMAMTDELGPIPAPGAAIANGWIGIRAFWHPSLSILVLAALALAVLRPTWRIAASWGICVAAVFALGLLGRPGVLRVYVPLTFLLLMAPLLPGQFAGWRRRLAAAVLCLAAVVNGIVVVSDSRSSQIADEQARQGLVGFPSDPVIVWGTAFPYEAAYPVLGAAPAAMSYRLYGLGVFTLAPFSVAAVEERAGRGLIERLTGEGGLPLIAKETTLGLLEIYCRERLHGTLKGLSAQQFDQIRITWRRCEIAS